MQREQLMGVGFFRGGGNALKMVGGGECAECH